MFTFECSWHFHILAQDAVRAWITMDRLGKHSISRNVEKLLSRDSNNALSSPPPSSSYIINTAVYHQPSGKRIKNTNWWPGVKLVLFYGTRSISALAFRLHENKTSSTCSLSVAWASLKLRAAPLRKEPARCRSAPHRWEGHCNRSRAKRRRLTPPLSKLSWFECHAPRSTVQFRAQCE